MSVKYPHRLTFLRVGGCDACDYVDKESSYICEVGPPGEKLGWQHCEKCTGIVDEWKKKCVMPQKEVEKKIGQNFKVLRSNGKMEYGWTVKCEALRFSDGEDWSVFVYLPHKHLTKIVSLTDLQNWN